MTQIQIRRPGAFRLVLSALAALLTGLALTMDMALPALEGKAPVTRMEVLTEVLETLRLSLKGTFLPATLLALSVLSVSLFLRDRVRDRFFPALIDLVLAFFWLLGRSFSLDNSLGAVWGSPGQVCKACIYTLGIWNLLGLARRLFALLLDRSLEERRKNGKKSLLQRHPFALSLACILAAWAPHLALSWPAAMCYDTWIQIGMYLGRFPFLSHHPPVHTLLVGSVTDLFYRLTGSGSWGLFALAALQTLTGALVLAGMTGLMGRLRAPLWLLRLTLFSVCFLPCYTGYQALVLKDVPYTACFVLFMVQAARILWTPEGKKPFFSGVIGPFLLSLGSLGTCLFRNNGRYVLYIMVPILVLYCLVIHLRRGQAGLAVRALLGLVLPLVLALGLEAGVMRLRHVGKGSVGEALSLPFQQTARYLKTWPEDVTAEEEAAIDGVLDYEHLAELYDPRIADPVKATFKQDAGREALLAYFGAWKDMLVRHPLVCFEATVNQSYSLLYPLVENDKVYTDTIEEQLDFEAEYASLLNVGEEPRLEKADTIRGLVLRLMASLPFLGILTSLAVCNLLLIALFERMAARLDLEGLILLLPLVLSDGIILLAPVIQGHPRCGFPIVYSMPLLTAFALRDRALRKDRKAAEGSGSGAEGAAPAEGAPAGEVPAPAPVWEGSKEAEEEDVYVPGTVAGE